VYLLNEEYASVLGSESIRAVDVSLAVITRMPERFPMVYSECRRVTT
jgi:hypothetical protein